MPEKSQIAALEQRMQLLEQELDQARRHAQAAENELTRCRIMLEQSSDGFACIAHDFNNILSPLIGYAELLKLDIPTDSPLQPFITQILNAASRARNLVQQVLTSSRRTDSEAKQIKLQPTIREALTLLRATIPSTIDMAHHIDPLCGPVVADPTQVHQILMDLATNACYAMEENGGQMTVKLSQVDVDALMAQNTGLGLGPHACLSVIGTGAGISTEISEKKIDPYFSTKNKTGVAGLGLSVVQGIVKSGSGHIQVCSEIGRGTEFRVYLPVIPLEQVQKEAGGLA